MRTCPECQCPKYFFRSRRTVDLPEGGKATETKYRCRDCEYEWKVRVPVEEEKKAG